MKLNRSWTHKREHWLLSQQLVEASGPELRVAVLPLLRVALHEHARDWRPASVADLGDDHLVWWSRERAIVATACLSFSGPELGDEEVRLALEVIRKFAKSSVQADRYVLVHNGEERNRDARETIQLALESLIASGRAEKAEHWGRQKLLGEAFNGMLRHAWTVFQQSNLSTAPIEALTSQYPFVALESVPCDLSLLHFDQHHLRETVPLRSHELLDPAEAMLDPQGELLTLVTGEFGLGKTTAVARAVIREERPLLYVAGARISKETVSKKDFLQQCFDEQKLFAGFPGEDRPTLERLSRPVVEYILQDVESQVAVIIDGLDESSFVGRRGGMQHLFNILQEIRAPIILTLRTEFWDRWSGSFAEVFGVPSRHGEPRNRRVRRIDLLPWEDDRIRLLIQRYREGVSDPDACDRLDELAALLARGELDRLYGDVPRRPLFLRFILDSVLADGLPSTSIGRARLFRDWAVRKLYRDIQAPVAARGFGRLPIVAEAESDAGAVETAWEAMLWAAASMIEMVEGELELTPDCPFDCLQNASPELQRIVEPLGVFLNSLLLPAGPNPLGTPLRVRFAHRAFQEFFLSWFFLVHPGRRPAAPLPDPVREWTDQIQSEGLVPSQPLRSVANLGRRVLPVTYGDAQSADLEMRVRTFTDRGQTRLIYELHSPVGLAPFSHREIQGPSFAGSPQELHRRLLEQIEQLGRRLDVDGALVLEVQRKLNGLGRSLWQQLFNEEMRSAYRRFRESVRTLLIVSDEPWIPWEMIKPYDDQGEILDDEFLAERFELTRWLSGDRPAPREIEIHAFAYLEQGGRLPMASKEKDLLTDLFRQAGLRDASPKSANVEKILAVLEKGEVNLVHYAGHGTFDATLPNEAGLSLPDGSVFRPSDLHGPLQTRLARDRPVVFLNACQSGRQGWSWTGLGGWADRWVRLCGCGAFIGAQWNVKDSIAFAFARGFYESLTRGETLGKAAKAARQAAREAAPENPSWLAYAVYGHPNARVIFGAPPAVAEAQPARVELKRSAYFDEILSAPPAEKTVPAISSNLRIKRRFTDRDRDQFVEESFDFIADFFESSLAELQKQNTAIETRFRRVDRNRFTAAIYVDGKKESSCRIWMDRGHLGDIAYATGDSGPENTYNETLSVQDDGYSLFFRPMGIHLFGSSDRKALTPQEGAEYLWSMLVERLQ